MLETKKIARIALTAGDILLIPLLIMQFTNEVVLSPLDFAVFGILLFAIGIAIELAMR